MKREQVYKFMFWSMAMLILAGVFSLYLRPEFMVSMAEQLWFCFS